MRSTRSQASTSPRPSDEAKTTLQAADPAAGAKGSSLPPDEDPERPTKKRRSRTGCLTCRKRKVKCDETTPVCRKCRKGAQTCRWASTYTPPPNDDAGGQYPASHLAGDRSALGHEPQFKRETNLGEQHDLHSLIQAYFRHIAPIQANHFIHRASLLKSINDKTASPILLKAISAAASRFLPNADPEHSDGGRLARRWAQEAKHHLMDDTEHFSKAKLASTLILIEHEYASGRNASAWFLVSIAVRSASAMGFNRPNPQARKLPWLEQEIRRRLMWATYATDSISSGGMKDYTLSPAESIEVPLPCSEHSFNFGIDSPSVMLQDTMLPSPESCLDPSSDGFMSRFVRLMAIRAQVLRFVREDSQFGVKPWEPGSSFENIMSQLRHWRESLRPEMRFSIENMYALHGTADLNAFILLHMWHDQLHSTLYRIAIPGLDVAEPPPTTQFLANAPAGWVDKLAHGNYIRSCAMRQKFVLLSTHFPDLVPTSWHLAMFAFNCTRETLGYLDFKYPHGIMPGQKAELVTSFEIMLKVLGRMAKYYLSMRIKLRDIVQMLRRSGFDMPAGVWDQDINSGSRTPEGSSPDVLTRIPYLRRFIRHPPVDSSNARTENVSENTEAVDPVSMEPVATSPRDQLPSTSSSMQMLGGQTPQTPMYGDSHNDLSDILFPSTTEQANRGRMGPHEDQSLLSADRMALQQMLSFEPIDPLNGVDIAQMGASSGHAESMDLSSGIFPDDLSAAGMGGGMQAGMPIASEGEQAALSFQPYPELVDFERYFMNQIFTDRPVDP